MVNNAAIVRPIKPPHEMDIRRTICNRKTEKAWYSASVCNHDKVKLKNKEIHPQRRHRKNQPTLSYSNNNDEGYGNGN